MRLPPGASLADYVPATDSESKNKKQIEKMAINDALPLKAARRDAIAKLTSFFGVSNVSYRQTKCRFMWIRCGARYSEALSVFAEGGKSVCHCL